MSIGEAFRMPTPMTISGRLSSITAAFVSAIIPQIQPTEDEIGTALRILQMNPDDVRCAYCGENCTEWDHLRPLVRKRTATGFISEIRNLVPSCGTCNQSKGNMHWKTWAGGDAKRSPKTRRVKDLEQRIARLEEYERWGNVEALDLSSMVPQNEWKQHWANLEAVGKEMGRAQDHAMKLKEMIEQKVRAQRAR